ncbi:MAG TPA: hypothetical protein VF116_18965 [Ktedonobacterales bacterium]
MSGDNSVRDALRRLTAEDAVGQLRRRDGRMAVLGSEDGALKLDWVEAVARLLADPVGLERVEAEARAIRDGGIRHIIWAGMGGSVLTVRVLCALGFGGGAGTPDSTPEGDGATTIYPLDSTDPAALNAVVRAIAGAKRLALPEPSAADALAAGDEHSQSALLRALFHDVMMIGVAMGMTSEEPITHLTWFGELLDRARLPAAEHLLVMTLPGSYLDAFAQAHGVPSRPLQLDGGSGTGGRMSAPGTRVFLLPAALYLTGQSSAASGQLRALLRQAWQAYDLDLAVRRPAEHPFVRLAAALSAASHEGTCRLMVRMPPGWESFVSWLEQLMEESLGKDGKGVVVFGDQTLNPAAPAYRDDDLQRVRVVTEFQPEPDEIAPGAGDHTFMLSQPSLASAAPRERLAALAASFLGWQLSMALYGYLHGIPFAGQLAVEDYKARARALRTQGGDPLRVTAQWQPALHSGALTLLAPASVTLGESASVITDPASGFARLLCATAPTGDDHGPPSQRAPLGYLDVTVNGEATAGLLSLLDTHTRTLGNTLLGVPIKLRRAPAAYHSTEQSAMDGPAALVSLRLVARDTEACLLGNYTNQFLLAQAVSTWQAMIAVGRPCCLLVLDGSLDGTRERLSAFFERVGTNYRAHEWQR